MSHRSWVRAPQGVDFSVGRRPMEGFQTSHDIATPKSICVLIALGAIAMLVIVTNLN